MQTLPFVATKTNMANSQVESVSAKQTDESGTPFTEVLSNQLAQGQVKQEAETKDHGLSLVDVDELGTNETFEKTVEVSVDAQTIALDMTAKTVQEATDGQVVLAPAEEAVTPPAEVLAPTEMVKGDMVNAEAAKQGNPILSNMAVTVNAPVDTKVAMAKETDAKTISADVANGRQVAADAKAASAGVLQKEAIQAEADQVASDKFAQSLIADLKGKTAQEPMMNKAMAGVSDASAVATAASAIQQPAAKFTAAPVTQAGSDNYIPVYPGKTGWNEAVGQKIVWMVGAAEQSAKLTLNPPALGPLEVVIEVNNDKADATFISENPEVRKALEEGVSTLRQLMGQAGVELGQANVNSSKQQEFQQAREQLSNQEATSTDGEEDGAATHANSHVVTHERNGLVDTFA